MNKYKYFVFEGADGIGKTILSKNFAERIGAHWTCEPFNFDEETKYLRAKALTHSIDPLTREYFLLANRSWGLPKVLKKLQKKPLVSDRSFISGAVFAKMEGHSFQDWEKMAFPIINCVRNFNPTFILCKNKKFKNKDNPDDRYDSKPESFHVEVEKTFHEAFSYFLTPFIEFWIDFERSPQENLDRLLKELTCDSST